MGELRISDLHERAIAWLDLPISNANDALLPASSSAGLRTTTSTESRVPQPRAQLPTFPNRANLAADSLDLTSVQKTECANAHESAAFLSVGE